MKQKKRDRKGGSRPSHAVGLADESERRVLEEKANVKRRRKEVVETVEAQASDEEGEGQENFLDAQTTKKVLKQARAQLGDLKEEERDAEVAGGVQFDLSSDDEELPDEDEEEEEVEEFEYLEESQITAEEERALAMFGMSTGVRRTLADIIQEKLDEAERKKQEAEQDDGEEDPTNIKVLEVYKGVGEYLKKFTVGKVPKAFKIIPTCENWEKLLWLTNPVEWSPASVFVATRVFASNFDSRKAQYFMHEVLLPRTRDDIAQNKKLHFSIYQALKKALFKPRAFFKGVVFPLCEDPSCTLLEATIVGSTLAKVSVPMLHSAAALLRIANLPYSGTNSLFIRILLDKKYALPYKVVDALVDHFAKMENDTRTLPVLWQRSLLTFAQRYKTVMTREQKDQLKGVMRHQFHPQITPEIRRELFSTRSRGEVVEPDANTVAMQIASAS